MLPQSQLLRKQERLLIVSFYNQQSSKTEVLEVCLQPGSTVVLLWRRAEAQEWAVWSEDPLHCTGRDSPPSWSAFGDKEMVGATALPHSLAQGQRHLLMAANLDASSLLCFILNSKHLYIPATALLGQTPTSPSASRPPSRGSSWVQAVLSPQNLEF